MIAPEKDGGISVTLADNVRRLRQRRRMSQGELASRIGVSYSRISEIENGHGNPRIKTVEALAKALGTSVAKLVAEKKREKAA